MEAGLFHQMKHYKSTAATNEQLLRTHEVSYINSIEHAIPEQGLVNLDGDTGHYAEREQ